MTVWAMSLFLLVVSAFGSHIPHIVGGCSQEEVVRTNTPGIVATMAHMQAEIECPVGERKRHAVGTDYFALD